MSTGACQSVVFIVCNILLGFFNECCKLWSHKTIILEEQLKLFHLCSTVQQVLKDLLHISGRLFMSAIASYVLKWLDDYMCPMYLNVFCHGWGLLRMNLVYNPCVLVIIFLSVCFHLRLPQPLSRHHVSA